MEKHGYKAGSRSPFYLCSNTNFALATLQPISNLNHTHSEVCNADLQALGSDIFAAALAATINTVLYVFEGALYFSDAAAFSIANILR